MSCRGGGAVADVRRRAQGPRFGAAGDHHAAPQLRELAGRLLANPRAGTCHDHGASLHRQLLVAPRPQARAELLAVDGLEVANGPYDERSVKLAQRLVAARSLLLGDGPPLELDLNAVGELGLRMDEEDIDEGIQFRELANL